MLLAMAQDVRVVLIKLAMRLHDLRQLSQRPAEEQQRIAKETLDIFRRWLTGWELAGSNGRWKTWRCVIWNRPSINRSPPPSTSAVLTANSILIRS